MQLIPAESSNAVGHDTFKVVKLLFEVVTKQLYYMSNSHCDLSKYLKLARLL